MNIEFVYLILNGLSVFLNQEGCQETKEITLKQIGNKIIINLKEVEIS